MREFLRLLGPLARFVPDIVAACVAIFLRLFGGAWPQNL
jgi:hypothetical protein